MYNFQTYLTTNKKDWYLDIPLIIAHKSTKLWFGKGFLFNSSENKILDYLNNMNIQDKWYEKFSKFGLQQSLQGKAFIMLMINEDNSKSIRILPNAFNGRVAKYNEEEQSAEFFFINEQADSATLTWVTMQNGKVKYESYYSENKDIILGSTKTKLKPNIKPKSSYEVKNPWNYLPIFEITNLPVINFYGNSTVANAYPDCAPIYDLIDDLMQILKQKRVERTLNVTKGFGQLNNKDAEELSQGNKEVKEYVKDFMVNVGSAGYDKNGNGGLQVIQGNPKFSEYWLDFNGTMKLIFNGAGYDYDEHGSDVYTNKTQSMFNNKFDMETTETKIAFYSTYFYRMFDLLLISENLWNGIGERPYSFDFIPIAMTDQIIQDQLLTSRLNNKTITRQDAISQYENIDSLMAKAKLEAIRVEELEDIELLGLDKENDNEQTASSFDENSTH